MLVRRKLTDGALDEAEAAQVAHLLQLELQDLAGRAVQPRRSPAAPSPRLFTSSMLRSDSVVEPASAVVSATMTFWICLDPPAQHRAEHAEHRHGQEVDRRDQPVHAERVDHHEDDADERREQHVDRRRDQLLDVGAHLLQLAERLAAALILEHRVGQLERVPDAVRVELRAEPLRDDVDEVVLEVLRDARDERHADRRAEQQADAAEELAGRVLLEPGGVLVDDVAEDQRIEQREDLVDRRQHKRQRDQAAVVPEVAVEQLHDSGVGCRGRRPSAVHTFDVLTREADPGGGPSVRCGEGARRYRDRWGVLSQSEIEGWRGSRRAARGACVSLDRSRGASSAASPHSSPRIGADCGHGGARVWCAAPAP